MIPGLLPYQEIFVWSVALSLLMTLASRFLADQQEVKKSKKDMEFFRNKSLQAQKSGDIKKMNEYTGEMMKASSKQFRLNLKPMMFSFLIVILAASWFASAYGTVKIASPISIPFIGNELNWFWWYVIIVLPFSMIFRKLMDVA
jgi:uncharacterized membrane protein (DUF106 family)